MPDEKRFPILFQCRTPQEERALRAVAPRSVPWGFVTEHERQCQRNHSQTVQRLAERGGLSPAELVHVLRDEQWDLELKDLDAVPELLRRLDEWTAKNQ
jgi:hypothetical protein